MRPIKASNTTECNVNSQIEFKLRRWTHEANLEEFRSDYGPDTCVYYLNWYGLSLIFIS